MNPTDFFVLLLAWDDADPAVVVLGGSALPPTLPLVYQLAAQRPVLALYPHLPAAEATAALESSAPAGASANADGPAVAAVAGHSAAALAASGPLEAAADAPGVHLLPPGPLPATTAGGSRLVGLGDLLPAIQRPLPAAHSLSLAAGHAFDASGTPATDPPAAAGHSQWPTRTGPPLAGPWRAPAAPYAGTAATAVAAPAPPHVAARVFFPSPPAPPRLDTPTAPVPLAARGAGAAPAASATLAPVGTAVPGPFDEPVEEMGAAEARALDAPADDLVPDASPLAAAAVAAAVQAAAPAPAATWALRQPALDGLNARMIQYARRAAQLVADRQDFGVIYAPNWPAWLAALEIHNRSGRPLVLYAAGLASDTAPAAERGWLLGLERMVLRRATLVLVPDAETLAQLRARHADVPGEIRVVPAADEGAVQRVLAEVARG